MKRLIAVAASAQHVTTNSGVNPIPSRIPGPGSAICGATASCALDACSRELAHSHPGQRAPDHIERVVHAGVDAGVADQCRERVQRGLVQASSRPAPVANAKAAAVWPEGNEPELGILTRGRPTPNSPLRSGRRRGMSGLKGRLTTAEVTPTDAIPCTAARVPFRPPASASKSESPTEIRE
jgi:hypothetical protein